MQRMLQWVNLRPEESERTLLMFAFYTISSVGLRWAEDSTVALFLDEYGARLLPWIYIASAAIGGGLGFFYSWLQKFLPLRLVIVAIAPCMVLPLFLLRLGLNVPFLAVITIFLLRLWVDALYVVNDLNTSITANQLFNIREIKRTYPLISSGILVADVLSGFSLPVLLQFVGLHNVVLVAAGFMLLGTVILLYLSQSYQHAFPDARRRANVEEPTTASRRLQRPLRRYTWLLFAFFGCLQVISLLIDFQYLNQLEKNFNEKQIASFLGLFNGVVGLFELATQWFISSRVIERLGVFVTAGTLPGSIAVLLPSVIGMFSLIWTQEEKFLWGLILLKFLEEILRYTFVVSSGPVLFQPIPDAVRSHIQTLSGGIAEAIATGLTGALILITLHSTAPFLPLSEQNWVLVAETVILALGCLGVLWLLRSRYVDLLVLSAERGQISMADVDLRTFKQAVVEALERPGSDADKRSCIELLSQIDPRGVGEVLAPLLVNLSPDLQRQSLEAMLQGGANPVYLPQVSALLQKRQDTVPPEVFATVLRYVWLSEENPDLRELEDYLHPRQNPLIRGTAAALLLRQGTPMQKNTATRTLRRMLTHKLERERVCGTIALKEAVYLQALRIYIPNLLQDDSLRVRCAVLETIAATHLEEYYSALLAGLSYKSTRTAAIQALVRLENEALSLLLEVATNIYQREVVRISAWRAIGQIGTLEAIDTLWHHLETSVGTNRKHILRTLVKLPKEARNEGILDWLNISRVENLIEEELRFLGEIYAAGIDLQALDNQKDKSVQQPLDSLNLLENSLADLQADALERLLWLMKLLYPTEKIQAAAFHLRSSTGANLARGLEILDNTINLRAKPVLLDIFDRRPTREKLHTLTEAKYLYYQAMAPGDRLRRLLDFQNLLSDWCLACCINVASVAYIRLSGEQIEHSLRHPTGFVREAAIAYLKVVSPRTLIRLLPQLEKDPDRLVASQVRQLKQWMKQLQLGNG
jgi:hypothetical protein